MWACAAQSREKSCWVRTASRCARGGDSFPGRMENGLKATVAEVSIDADSGLARFVLTCNSINGDVLCLNRLPHGLGRGAQRPAVPAAAVTI